MNATFAIDHATHLVANPALGWIPGPGMEYTTTPCRLDRGVFGGEDVFIVRRRVGARWAYDVVTVSARALRGLLSGRVFACGPEGIHSREAIDAVCEWSTRGAAVAVIAKI